MLGLDPATLIARVVTLLIAFTIHELAHAVAADRLGDPTARNMGRFSLNPLVHLDPMGSIMLVLTGFGWAKPVMVNPYNLRGNPRTGMALVAAAGPASNLIMALLAAIPYQMGLLTPEFFSTGTLPSISFMLTQFIWINLILAFFNLIPIPPLDGYKILIAILPAEMAYQLRPLERYGFMILIAFLFILPMAGIDVLGTLVMAPASQVMSLLMT